ncbi:MAG: DUF177 domain-containing protein [Acidimicrobiales bacterium]|nr:DUF177 domain-containing protein [Acidimicrobiales bacterium]
MERRPLVVNVADLLRRPASRREVQADVVLPGLSVGDVAVPDGHPLHVDAVLESMHEGLVASGAVDGEWAAPCRRCLMPAAGRFRAEFRELFSHHPIEGESYPIAHEQVDLEQVLREVVLLELPLAPLCREGCLGLCPVCGADRNLEACDCVAAAADPRWAALDRLRFDTPGPPQ